MRAITFDIETSNIFTEVGSNRAEDLDIAVVCIHDSLDNTFSSYTVETLPKLWKHLEAADLLITFNGDHFDIPLLNKYYAGDLTHIKSIDLLKEVKKSLGKRIKLDSIAEATLGSNKSADGLQALRWWREGKKEEVIKYCIEDVRITRAIYDYAQKHQMLKYIDFGPPKRVQEIPIDTSGWENRTERAMTGSLF